MNFLEANKIARKFTDGMQQPVLLAMSGTADQLDVYLRAHAVRYGVALALTVLPFGTLGQHLHTAPADEVPELFLLLPWDLAPECDWRTGMRPSLANADSILERAENVAGLLAKRSRSRFAYLPAPIPPVCATHGESSRLAAELAALAARLGASILPSEYFSMGTYLANGCPVAGTRLSDLAEALIDLLLMPSPGTFKVVATDADNTLWAGLVGEDGVDAVLAEPQGRSFRHFIYQGFLMRLKAAGILLAVISRNDEDMVRAPLASGRMPLSPDDFVAIRAGYGTKSVHVKGLAEDLNLGVDSIVFVDDNPVELAEVASAIPGITCHVFPSRDDDLPAFLDRMARLFSRHQLTEEDAQRTEMYRRRLISQPPRDGDGLTAFLKGLEMVLKVRDRTGGDIARAHQLINKTNQFNLNGVRLEEGDLQAVLDGGGRIVTATLDDRTGNHGEILACLIDASGLVRSFVMSCRVFERRVEFAFAAWLLNHWNGPPLHFSFQPTERNEPIRRFLKDPAFVQEAAGWLLNSQRFISDHSEDMALFSVQEVRA